MTGPRVPRSTDLLLLFASFLATGCLMESEGDSRALPRQAAPPDLAHLVTDMQDEWSIPGIALSVVEGDETVFVGTYGVRERGQGAPVTPDTMFGIASITKVLVAGGLAVLVDEGKLDWDDRVRDHLPDFSVADPYVSSQVTVRDLLAHRSGIASYGDWLEEIPGLSESAALERMAYLDQSVPFRSRTQYSSYSFIILTEIIRKLTGKPWGEFLDERLWTPLGMDDTHAHADDFIPPGNVLPTGDGWSATIAMGQAAVAPDVDVATPHVKWEAFIDPAVVFEQRELEFDISHFHRSAIDPGQGAFTSISDLAKWARVLLNDGTSGGRAVLEPGTVREMRRLHGPYGRGTWPLDAGGACDTTRTDLRVVGVGLGLFIYDYCGHALYGHSGGELGYESLMVIDPEQDFAVIVFVNNTRSAGSTNAIVQTVLDWRYGYGDRAWPDKYREDAIDDARERFSYMSERDAAQLEVGIGGDEARRYVGQYQNPFAGFLDVRQRADGVLVATTGESYLLELSYRGADQFRAVPVSPIRFWLDLEFGRDTTGEVAALAVSHRYFHRPLRFERVAESEGSAAHDTGSAR